MADASAWSMPWQPAYNGHWTQNPADPWALNPSSTPELLPLQQAPGVQSSALPHILTKGQPNAVRKKKVSKQDANLMQNFAANYDDEGQLDEHAQGINDVAWGHDATFLATASDDKTVKLWESDGPTDRAQALSTLSGHASYVFCCAFSPRGNHLLATGSYDETVKLWDVRTGRCCKTLPAHSDPVTAVDFSLDGTVVE